MKKEICYLCGYRTDVYNVGVASGILSQLRPTVDHVIPQCRIPQCRKGGSYNLRIVHALCNFRKSTREAKTFIAENRETLRTIIRAILKSQNLDPESLDPKPKLSGKRGKMEINLPS